MRKKHPPEFKAHRYTDLTIWELLEREALLDPIYSSVWQWTLLTTKQRRRYERERRALQATRLAGYTPSHTLRRRVPDPWLYVTTTQGTHYRFQSDTVERWAYHKSGGISAGWGWAPTLTSTRRWLGAIRSALSLRRVRAERAAADAAHDAPTADATPPIDHHAAVGVYAQLVLFD